jgi:hypothetical protein
MQPDRVTLSREEAEEFYAYLRNQYLDVNRYPHLSQLWTRVSIALRKQEELIAKASR